MELFFKAPLNTLPTFCTSTATLYVTVPPFCKRSKSQKRLMPRDSLDTYYCLNPLALVLLALNLTYHSSSSFREVAPPLPQPVSWLDRNRSWSTDPCRSRAEEADSGPPLSSPSKRSACSVILHRRTTCSPFAIIAASRSSERLVASTI
ncbi:hypothetical protein S83_018654 [Arachis hypogaea]|nr:uncharacterized protein DS421_14g469030 [Arachis hypogaea]